MQFQLSVLLLTLVVMERFVDRIPVRTEESGSKYDGRVYFERLSAIRTVNGQPVYNLEKSSLKDGDSVTYIYRSKTFSGYIDCKTTPPSPLKDDNKDSEQQEQQLDPSNSRRGKRPQSLSSPHRAKKIKLAGKPNTARCTTPPPLRLKDDNKDSVLLDPSTSRRGRRPQSPSSPHRAKKSKLAAAKKAGGEN